MTAVVQSLIERHSGSDNGNGADHMRIESQHASVSPDLVGDEAMVPPLPNEKAPVSHAQWQEADAFLLIAAETLDDLENVRTANENRLRSIRDVRTLMSGTSQEAELAGLVDAIRNLEHQAELTLKRTLRRHPLGEWVRRTHGIGEKQGARLLAAIGDPYWNAAADRCRRGPAELWAYCGYHVVSLGQSGRDTQHISAEAHPSDPDVQTPFDVHSRSAVGAAPSRRRGQKANWNDTARSRAYLIAESCMKQTASPYRAVYEAGRVKYAEALHPTPCRRCGPAGKPAETGSPLSLSHQHGRALRLVAKAVLRDLFLESKRLHESSPVASVASATVTPDLPPEGGEAGAIDGAGGVRAAGAPPFVTRTTTARRASSGGDAPTGPSHAGVAG